MRFPRFERAALTLESRALTKRLRVRDLFGEPNEYHYGILRLPVNCGTADMFAKWPILAEKASLRRVNAAWLSRSERRAYVSSTLRPPTFSGDSLASAV